MFTILVIMIQRKSRFSNQDIYRWQVFDSRVQHLQHCFGVRSTLSSVTYSTPDGQYHASSARGEADREKEKY